MFSDRSFIPEPFRNDHFSLVRSGIWDDEEISAYENEDASFAFLHPTPETDYNNYKPRAQHLGLEKYKKNTKALELRYQKMAAYFQDAASFLEIGASNAAFLAHVKSLHPDLECAAFEPDVASKGMRDEISWLKQYDDIEQTEGCEFELIGAFHVLEHILQPQNFLERCRKALSAEGRLLIEVPALTDPLLSVYKLPEYEKFFYQRQHPFYYSTESLRRLLEVNGFKIERMIPHQRYGIENHLNWLRQHSPGGDSEYLSLFLNADGPYRKCLERAGKCDAAIAVARPA